MVKRLSFLDLRKELATLESNVAFSWVALRSAQLGSQCSACMKRIGPQYGIPSPSCVRCLGSGYLFVDKLVRAYQPRPLPGVDFFSELGLVNTKTQAFFLKEPTKPKNTDFILELDLDEATGIPRQPFTITRIFSIQTAESLRGVKGRIEYWMALTEERNFDRGQGILTAPIRPVPPRVIVAGRFGFPVNQVIAELGTDNKFDWTDINGTKKKITLQPNESPPVGKIPYTDINGVQRLGALEEI
jgi:hypothetical protein